MPGEPIGGTGPSLAVRCGSILRLAIGANAEMRVPGGHVIPRQRVRGWKKGQRWRSVAVIAVHEGRHSRGWERPVTPYWAREGGKVGCTRSTATRKPTADLDGRGKSGPINPSRPRYRPQPTGRSPD
jgi:hypothetical protein